MRLFSTLQSMRLCADAEIVSARSNGKNRRSRSMKDSLQFANLVNRLRRSKLRLYKEISVDVACNVSLVAQGLHRIETRSAACGVQTGQQADDNRECDGSNHQPPRYKPNLFWRKV